MALASNTADTAASAVRTDVQNQVTQSVTALDQMKEILINHGPDIIYAVVIFIIGLYIAKGLKNIAVRMMTHANYDHTVITFVSQLVYYAMMAIVLLSALNKAGIPTDSFLAAFGAFGLAVGLALQNNLSNFASGLLILIFKPFKAGDWVSINDVSGSIKGIQMLNTAIITKDNRTVFIPNSVIYEGHEQFLSARPLH